MLALVTQREKQKWSICPHHSRANSNTTWKCLLGENLSHTTSSNETELYTCWCARQTANWNTLLLLTEISKSNELRRKTAVQVLLLGLSLAILFLILNYYSNWQESWNHVKKKSACQALNSQESLFTHFSFPTQTIRGSQSLWSLVWSRAFFLLSTGDYLVSLWSAQTGEFELKGLIIEVTLVLCRRYMLHWGKQKWSICLYHGDASSKTTWKCLVGENLSHATSSNETQGYTCWSCWWLTVAQSASVSRLHSVSQTVGKLWKLIIIIEK